ncbi:MAG: hypothetical protein JWR61_604 [Ferruginibacter sp.]|uniref:hypothetical protein n=1 Tax=Ferruginibacter sp. TaxID=1940288 RepID=UPI00265800A1|nr:hypothetical protein [Ferruginibacter sp.]MDB5275649.1 hypothetical protein [Ferruginibacter sp.]
MLKISIPKPCNQSWMDMAPNQNGRYCDVCGKSVIDFSGLTDDEVQHYFTDKKEEKVCGRFRTGQVQPFAIHLPETIFSMSLPLWKCFLAASLLAFGTILFSCCTTKGEPDLANMSTNEKNTLIGDTVMISQPAGQDSLQKNPQLSGSIKNAWMTGKINQASIK